MFEETEHGTTQSKAVDQQHIVSRLEKTVKYYERMHRDARTALDIAGRMSLEIKEQLIEARQKLERAKLTNTKLSHIEDVGSNNSVQNI